MAEDLNLLIAEDDEDDAVLVVRELRRGGFEPAWKRVESAGEMERALQSALPDVIISDYKMPQFSAPAALDVARRLAGDIPFIVVSGTIGEEIAVELMRAGAHDYLIKGNLRRLPEAVRREIREARIRAERKQALAALHASEDRYRTLVETLEDAVFSIDLDGRVNFISAAVERMTSYTVAEIVGRPFSDFIHPDDLAGVLDRYQRALRGETLAYEYRLLDRDGRVVHVQTRSHLLLRDGVTVGLAGLITDITTRKRAEENLHIKDAAIHSSISPIGLADLEGRIIYVNRAFCRLWRYSSPEEIMGRPFSGFAESPESGVKALEALLTTGAYVGEQEARSRDGARIDVQVSASVVTDPAGRPLCLMASFLDITDRKAADARLRASLTEKETLLKEIHHRVKNNLQIINSLLSLQANEITDPVFQEVFRESQHRVRAMALVHEQLYRSNDLARIDFGDYLHNVTSQLAASFGKETIRWSVASDAVSFAIDTAIPCGLVASELVTNALKHAFVGRSRGSISVTLQREEGTMLALRVADDGVGFPAELDFAAVRSMGASLIRALVSQLGGTLAVERGSGTTIVVRFPVAEDGAADPSA